MLKHNQDGAISGLGISLVLAILLLIGAIGFGAWAFSSRQDYKNNSDVKASAAAAAAVKQESIAKDAQFATAEKNPLQTYTGPEAYGSLIIKYPKTWSGYVNASSTNNSGNALLAGYFYPGVVPSTTDPNSAFALQVQVLSQSYTQVLQSFTASQVPTGQSRTINPYALPKVPSSVGVEISGVLGDNGSTPQTGTMVILPLRSNTLEISTDGNTFLNDFNTNILPNFSFSP